MNFPCPKCNSSAEFEGPHIPAEGASAKCPECKTRFWIARESFARRAIRKDGKPLCSSCSHELGNYLDCPACGAIYPDLFIVQLSKPVARKQRKSSAAIGFSIRPQRKARTFADRPVEKSSGVLLKVIGLLIVLALAGAAVVIPYLNHKAEQAYADNIFRALYGIKLGADLNFKQCATLAAAAKSTGQNVNLLITDKDKSVLNSAKSDIDLLMQRVPNAPQKFSKVNDSFTKLYGIYGRSYDLASSPTGSVSAFANSAASLENEFRQAGAEFKGNLPAALSEEFKKATQKYKKLEEI